MNRKQYRNWIKIDHMGLSLSHQPKVKVLINAALILIVNSKQILIGLILSYLGLVLFHCFLNRSPAYHQPSSNLSFFSILLVPYPTKILRFCSDSIATARCILRLASARTSSVTAERAKSSEHLAFAIGPSDFQCEWDSQYFPVNPTYIVYKVNSSSFRL